MLHEVNCHIAGLLGLLIDVNEAKLEFYDGNVKLGAIEAGLTRLVKLCLRCLKSRLGKNIQLEWVL